MSWLEQKQADRAVSAILKAPRLDERKLRQALEKLKPMGPAAIPPLVAALARGSSPRLIEELLAGLISEQTLPPLREALCHEDPQVAQGVARVLALPGRYDPNQMIDLFMDPGCPKPLLGQLLSHHGRALQGARLVRVLDDIPEDAKTPLLELIHLAVKPQQASELTRRLATADPVVRVGLVKALGRIASEDVQRTLVRVMLGDGHKPVRLAAIDALVAQKLPVPLGPLFQLLKDPDMMIQGKVLEVLVELDQPGVAKRAAELIEDGDESARRAAVEILNRRPEEDSVVPLVRALRDDDWWVRERAADALAGLGGESLFNRLLPLLAEGDPELHEGVVKILRRQDLAATCDRLIACLKNGTEATQRGAIAALGALGVSRAVFPLLGLLVVPELESATASALRELADPEAVSGLINHLKSGRSTDPVAVIDTAVALVDRERALELARVLRHRRDAEADASRRDHIVTVLADLEARFEHVRGDATPPSVAEPPSSPSVTVLTSAPINPLTLTPDQIVGERYRVIRAVGQGGFGVVILVEDEIVNESMILKFLAPHVAQDEVAIERFKHELRYARRITHENVIRIYDLLSLGGTFAISMEYFASHSLSKELRGDELMDPQRALHVVRAICSGLAVAHREGVVHRDLKPGNILIGKDDHVKIVDFGLAAAASHAANRLTRSGLLVGTPAYMAPEQIDGRELNARTDIYSLGVMMYELFTGAPPYDSENPLSLLLKHLDGKPEPLRKRLPGISEELQAVVLKAMAHDPDQRYQSVDELAQDLEDLEAAAS